MHHVDLGLGYSAAEWPVGFVTRGLEEAMSELPDRAVPRARTPVGAAFRIEATDHDRAWLVCLTVDGATVERDDSAAAPADGAVSGWGCDVLAWLYGRDPSGAGITGSGDLGGLRLPEWFPFG